MGIFQRYTKQDKDEKDVLGKDGKPIKTGPWFVQYPHTRDLETGKIKYRTEKASFSKKKAEAIFRAKVDAFQEKDKLGTQVDREITLSGLIDWGLKQEVMRVKASASDDMTRARPLKSVLGDYKAVQITPLMVDNFRIQMTQTISESTKKPYSGTTINKMVSLARRIYYLAMDAGIVSSNPFARRGTFKEEPKGKYIPDDEFRAICSSLPEYMKPVVVTGYLTGMRRGEIIELKWERVDLFGGFIDLTPDDTKTDEPRRIYFNAVKELRDVFVKAERDRRPGQKLVFTKPDGKPVPKWYMDRLYGKACDKAGVGPYRFHDLRHTFNTNMVKAGVDKIVIMKLTGHKTDKMFTRYSHLDKELGEGAMGKLDAFLVKTNDKNHIKKEKQAR
ncbi:tyrosine-type recombinase/integrase [Thermodesulfobacteriota bacterium]